ncbi:hypothetical protein MMC08_009064 [Hypocenomyce scalaris]|nr:hypothetical protein [Hypocenomyce scalaris]
MSLNFQQNVNQTNGQGEDTTANVFPHFPNSQRAVDLHYQYQTSDAFFPDYTQAVYLQHGPIFLANTNDGFQSNHQVNRDNYQIYQSVNIPYTMQDNAYQNNRETQATPCTDFNNDTFATPPNYSLLGTPISIPNGMPTGSSIPPINHRVPSNNKRYPCLHACGKTFARKGDMQRHTKLHGPPTLWCPQEGCKHNNLKGFHRKDTLATHLRTHGIYTNA